MSSPSTLQSSVVGVIPTTYTTTPSHGEDILDGAALSAYIISVAGQRYTDGAGARNDEEEKKLDNIPNWNIYLLIDERRRAPPQRHYGRSSQLLNLEEILKG
jgi:hypothetical protein